MCLSSCVGGRRRKATDAVSEDGLAGKGTHGTFTIHVMNVSGFRHHSVESVFILILRGHQVTLYDTGDSLELIVNRTHGLAVQIKPVYTIRAWSPLSGSKDSW